MMDTSYGLSAKQVIRFLWRMVTRLGASGQNEDILRL